MKNNYTFSIKSLLMTGALVLFSSSVMTSCRMLDLKPQDQVAPEAYYITAEQLGSFTVKYFPVVFSKNSGWHAGRATFDNGTDNQAAPEGNSKMFLQDIWRVPTSGGIEFDNIRNLNKFINETEAKYADGKISGSETEIKHFIGEAYMIRGLLYFQKLKTYGDFPIVLKELNIDANLSEASKRLPRNEVARQILKDMDKAISMLQSGTTQRINKNAALTLKSRVALYEATFELYHRGTGRVPGDANWPGKSKAWNADKTFNQQGEVDFFLTEAMNAAKAVGEQITLATANSHVMNPALGQYSGWNPYYEMFASADLSKYPEVLLWQQYNADLNITHLTSNKLRIGSGTGWTRGLVESFLMKSGLPTYAAGSDYKGDETIDDVKANRDERLQLFLFGESTHLGVENGIITKFEAPRMIDNQEAKDVTGYRQRKFYNYDPKTQNGQTFSDISGQIHVRVEEAYLNYIEASYLKNRNIDATAHKYWTALRNRAGITATIETTISATDMSKEADLTRPSYDWGAFSAGTPVDATLYSIRRERRAEFCGEGYRMDDLVRWAAMDQVKNYHVEGVNFWAKIHEYKSLKDENGKSKVIADGGEKSNASAKSLSTYFRPYQVRSNYNLYGGYTFYQAHYLSPFSIEEMQLCSPTGNVADSYLYQNINWPTEANGMALK